MSEQADRFDEALRVDPELILPIVEAFVRLEVERAGIQKGIVGLSGGMDSAVSAAITVRALGRERTVLVLMPHEVSSEASVTDARLVADMLGVDPVVAPITAMTEGYPGYESLDQVRAGNLMARMRMAVLYDLSAEHKALVIGTSNKSELLLGYGTLFGDMASAVNPIGDLYKTQLRQVAVALGIPDDILAKAPSADLWKGQTDESELGIDYATADAILLRLVDRRLPISRLVTDGFDETLVRRLWDRVRENEFKRHLPVICKLSERTVGIDWLYPRDWGT
jgi:NAD+ synthase